MLTCSVTLTPKQALAFRDLGIDLEYRCPNPGCDQPVMVIGKGKDKEGITYKAHFEHKVRNPNCHFGVGIKATPLELWGMKMIRREGKNWLKDKTNSPCN